MAIHGEVGSTEVLYRIERCGDVRVAWQPKDLGSQDQNSRFWFVKANAVKQMASLA